MGGRNGASVARKAASKRATRGCGTMGDRGRDRVFQTYTEISNGSAAKRPHVSSSWHFSSFLGKQEAPPPIAFIWRLAGVVSSRLSFRPSFGSGVCKCDAASAAAAAAAAHSTPFRFRIQGRTARCERASRRRRTQTELRRRRQTPLAYLLITARATLVPNSVEEGLQYVG